MSNFAIFSIETVVTYASSNVVRVTSACTQDIPCLTVPHIQNRPRFSTQEKHTQFCTVLAVHYLCREDKEHHFFSVRGEVICSSDRMHLKNGGLTSADGLKMYVVWNFAYECVVCLDYKFGLWGRAPNSYLGESSELVGFSFWALMVCSANDSNLKQVNVDCSGSV